MGSIQRQVDTTGQMTTFTVKGTVKLEDINHAIQEFYEKGPLTKNSVWDLTEATLDNLDSSEIYVFAQTPRPFLQMREGGKTAIITPTDLAFGLSRMFEYSVTSEAMPIDTKTFRTLEEALSWINEK